MFLFYWKITAMANSNPAPEHRFVKGDPRINRDGRPKDAASLSALARRIGHEKATTKDGKPVIGPDGKPMTVLEVIMRQWAQDPKRQEKFIDRAFGKVPDRIADADGKDFVLRVEYVNKRTDNNPTDAA